MVPGWVSMTKKSSYKKTWRQRHPEQWKALQQRSHKKRYAGPIRRAHVLETRKKYHTQVALECFRLKTNTPCFDCGKFDIAYLMDFDHLEETNNRSPQSCRNLPELRRELLKCNMVCVRCHRIRTHIRRHFVSKARVM